MDQVQHAISELRRIAAHYRNVRIDEHISMLAEEIDRLRNPDAAREEAEAEAEERAWTDDGYWHAPSSVHPPTCAGCTSDVTRHGKPHNKPARKK